MKKIILLVCAQMFFASQAFSQVDTNPANATPVENRLQSARVVSVSTIAEGEGFPSTRIIANVQYSNSCHVTPAENLFIVANHENNFDVLRINLVSKPSDRMCIALWAPVTVSYDLGVYTRPNDGFFSEIYVNGILSTNN